MSYQQINTSVPSRTGDIATRKVFIFAVLCFNDFTDFIALDFGKESTTANSINHI